MNHTFASVLFLLPSLVVAQSFTGVVATAGSLRATFGPQVQTTLLPAGAMASSNALSAFAGGALNGFGRAELAWGFAQDPVQAQFYLQQNMTTFGATPASASFGPGDFLITLHAPTPTNLVLDVSHYLLITAGMTLPTLQVDVGDDGSVEFASGQADPTPFPVAVGPAGLPVRVRTQLVLSTPGLLLSNVTLRATPAHTWVQPIVAACVVPDLLVYPHFAGEVSLQGGSFSNDPWLPVVGLSMQPTLLPHAPFPCLLLPAPDFVLPWAPFATLHTIPIPAAIRPITFWTQAVTVTPNGLQTSGAFRVDAL
jgi:hypothetical protein